MTQSIAFYPKLFKIHTVRTLHGENVEFLNVKPGGIQGNHYDLKG
jgi:hypothetical protein